MPGFRPEEVLDLWFPDDGHWETAERHAAFWTERMQGGMDAEICARFGPLTEAAAKGALDHWAETERGAGCFSCTVCGRKRGEDVWRMSEVPLASVASFESLIPSRRSPDRCTMKSMP